MRRISTPQIIVFGAAIISIVLLSFVNTTSPGGKTPKMMMPPASGGKSLDEIVADARKNLKPQFVASLNAIESSIKTNRSPIERGNMYDSLAKYLGQNREYVLAAYFAEQKAINTNGSGNDWEQAGERYFNASGFQNDEGNVAALLNAAIRCFNKALELEPKNLNAKVGLGSCIVQSGADPMKGIGMLLEVVKEDSTNVNAQLALADFSVQRKAPDLAIKRYEIALRLHPEYTAIYLSIGDLEVQMGDTASAIKHYQKYCDIETDPIMKNDVENAIRMLRKGK